MLRASKLTSLAPQISGVCATKGSLLLFIGLSLAGCTVLSREGPSSGSIEAGAAINVTADTSKAMFDYVLVDIDQKALGYFGSPKRNTLLGTFGNEHSPAPQIRLGVGDIVQVTIFEAQPGGLFIPSEAGARPGNFVSFPSQQIDGKGDLSIPYAGSIRASGRAIPDVQAEIEKKLEGRAIEPKVLITLATQRSSQVSVVGDVHAPSRIDINPAGDKIVDVLARAGGPAHPGYETYVTLERGNKKSTVFFDDILSDPKENIYTHPNDTIYVYREPETFLAFGATNSTVIGTTSLVEFGATRITLAEGLGKIGGIDDTRADSTEVFIYRNVDRSDLQNANIDISRFDASAATIPVIFRANFANPTSYFAAQKFYMSNKDVLYVDSSAAHELTKFLTLLTSSSSTITNTANTVPAIRSSKIAVQNFGH